MDMGKVEDWLSAIPSKYTRKSYKHGIQKFEEFYGKGIETLIKSEESGKTVEKFYAWLKEKGYCQNSCRSLVNAPIQFLKYFGTDVRYRKNLGIYRSVITTRDHRLTIQEAQEMAKVSDLREQILLEVLLLGLRIGDVVNLEWKTFDANGEPPIPIDIYTKKEGIVAKTFISAEFRELLDKYIPTLDPENPYLVQSKKGNLTTKRIDAILKDLAKRAGIKSHGIFRWHIGRKLFLRTCAELGISSWSAKMICGKAIPKSDDTYLWETNLKNDFTKISEVLKLKPRTANGKLSNLEEDCKLFAEALWELAKPIVERKRLERLAQKTQQGIGLLEMEKIPSDPREGLKLFLKWKKGEEGER
jgi:integrase